MFGVQFASLLHIFFGFVLFFIFQIFFFVLWISLPSAFWINLNGQKFFFYSLVFAVQQMYTVMNFETSWQWRYGHMETNERMKKKVNKFKINKTVRKNKLAIQFYRRNNLLMTVWKKNAHSKKKRQKKFVLVCSFWPKNQVSPIITWTRTKNFENYQVNAINVMLGLHVPMCNVCICICELYIVYKRWSFISTLMHTGLRHQSISLIFIIFSQ